MITSSYASSLGTKSFAIYSVVRSVGDFSEGITDQISNYGLVRLDSCKRLNKKVQCINLIIKKNAWWILLFCYVSGLLVLVPIKGELSYWECVPYVFLCLLEVVSMFFFHSYESIMVSYQMLKEFKFTSFIGVAARIITILLISFTRFKLIGLSLIVAIDFIVRSAYMSWCIKRQIRKEAAE